ncbi:bifunctional homocysteine S-methyltransferase/methylenetetrahydrofolate reductase [Ilumatobacter nonamiensis]|uniref:bifunctional homocysteine S-methyltransferase/methylenetetrahydrofolate reductase n=1 Tax=Ilumatobacter nonamiensis TaxID=467093 RepID=UPI00034B4369|nr:bifunctional homocysteine S-methyltransferase/methylenetetrahydrofolate reductase [Ilumatobacter nonamiensis]
MTTRAEFRARVTGRPLLFDGAMGTVLQSREAGTGHGFDGLNLTDPAVVGDAHRAYIEAGADVIETNTFGANQFRLAEHRAAGSVSEINAAGVAIARGAAGDSGVWVAGSVGPLGVVLTPIGRVTPAEAREAFVEQIQALVDAGVDLLVIETMPSIDEIEIAVGIARSLAPDLAILAMMTFADDDRTLLGLGAAEVARRLSGFGVDAIGVNCSSGPNQVLRLTAAMREATPGIAIAAIPNAGFPERDISGRVGYPATPEYFADYASAFVDAGISIVGGCCGTSEEHISAMRIAIDEVRPTSIAPPRPAIVSNGHDESVSADPPTALKQALEEGRFVATVEMRPPKGVAAQKMIASATMLREAGADFLDIADIPLARMRMSAWAAAHLVQLHTEVETILHFPTRGRNLLRVQADLLAAHALGVRNLFVTMGDPARIGDYPDASDDYDLASTGLIRLLKERMNAGLDQAGALLDQPTHFTVGCATSLTSSDTVREAALLAKKIRSGADFALTQPCFDAEAAREFIESYRSESDGETIPLLLGVQPLYNARNAEFLHNEVPGIRIPQHYRDRMRRADDPRTEGVAIALEIVEELRVDVQGIYVIPAFGRYDLAADLLDAIR